MKIIKKLLLCFLTLSLTLGLMSCNALDEMKAVHAIFDEETKTIRWNNDTYVLFTGDPTLIKDNVDYRKRVFVTTKDVPVLFSQSQGVMFYVNASNDILYTSNNYGSFKGSLFNQIGADQYVVHFDEAIYIKEGKEKEILETLKNTVKDHYCIDDGTGRSVLLSEETTKKLDETIKNKNNDLKEQEYETYLWGDYECTEINSLFKCDKLLLLTEWVGEVQLYRQSDTGEEIFILNIINFGNDEQRYVKADMELYREIMKSLQ